VDHPTQTIDTFLQARYSHLGNRSDSLRSPIMRLWETFRAYADPHFVAELCSGDESRFAQRVWEMVLADRLVSAGFQLSSASEGPDLLISKDGKKAWVEAIVPDVGVGANRLPDEYLQFQDCGVVNVPHEQILLRWTAATREKHRKYQLYLKNGTIGPTDHFIVAINSCLLGYCGFDGISQFPVAVEALIPVGPIQITSDRRTLKQTGQGHSYRASVLNANDAEVPTDNFTNPDHAGISAVLAAHVPPDDLLRSSSWIVVHNPRGTAPIPQGWLGLNEEYVATLGPDFVELTRHRMGSSSRS
jgi:hypothetical protein